jgi:hypothetical protein
MNYSLPQAGISVECLGSVKIDLSVLSASIELFSLLDAILGNGCRGSRIVSVGTNNSGVKWSQIRVAKAGK